jgi:daunorubicin resistance ABC transporter ATP-binding subunit
MAEPALLAEGVTKRFGPIQALTGVDLRLAAGSVLGLLGPNGAGKTTMVRILATLLPADSGHIHVAGFDVVRDAARVRKSIGLSGQFAAVDAYLTGRENLRMIGRLSGLGRRGSRERADDLLELFDLADAASRLVRTYSGGMRRRLDVAASLVVSPPVLFLDEPTTGLDPRGRAGLWTLLGELTRQGTAVLLTTQYLEEADRLADHIVVLDNGIIIAEGTSGELKARVGGDRLELLAAPGTDARQLAQALTGLGSGPPHVDIQLGRVVLPVTDGPGVLPQVAARLAEGGWQISDLVLRRPSLDDVFLTLTGAAPAALPAADTAGRGGGR